MTTTKEVKAVLQAHRREINTVSLQKANDCAEFWHDYANQVYYAIPVENNWGVRDWEIQESLMEFSTVDSLEVVNKKGRILKRFANYWKEQHGSKLHDSLLGIMGDILQGHLNNTEHTYFYDFTDIIDWNDGQFGKDDSCWWGCYDESKTVFVENGGWGIRFYEDMDDEEGIGRTWLLPRDNMLLGFNSYGVSRPTVSKVLKAIFASHGITLHYKQVAITNGQNNEIPYINGDSGFVLFPDDMNSSSVPSAFDLDMETSKNKEHCANCGRSLDTEDGDYEIINESYYCYNCAVNNYSFCDKCNERYDKSDVHEVHDDERYLCEYCAKSEGLTQCYECEKWVDEFTTDSDGDNFCEECTKEHLTRCDECQQYYYGSHECPSTFDFSGLVESHETNFHAQLCNGSWGQDYHENVTVYRIEGISGIALYNPHPINTDLKNSWCISHDASGLAVKSDIDSFSKAKQLFILLAPMTDWNQDARTISDNRELMSRVYNTVREILEG